MLTERPSLPAPRHKAFPLTAERLKGVLRCVSGMALMGYGLAVSIAITAFAFTSGVIRFWPWLLVVLGATWACFNVAGMALLQWSWRAGTENAEWDPNRVLNCFDYREIDLWLARYPEDLMQVARWAATQGTLNTGHLVALRQLHGKSPEDKFGGFTPSEMILGGPVDETTLETVAKGELWCQINALRLDQATPTGAGAGQTRRL